MRFSITAAGCGDFLDKAWQCVRCLIESVMEHVQMARICVGMWECRVMAGVDLVILGCTWVTVSLWWRGATGDGAGGGIWGA